MEYILSQHNTERREIHSVENLIGIRCEEEAEDVFDTKQNRDLMVTLNVAGTDVKVERVSLVSAIEPENTFSFRDIVGRTPEVPEDASAFGSSQDEKLNLHVPKACGGGKRLECIPYYQQQSPEVSALHQRGKVEELEPKILKMNAHVFFVRRENNGLVQEFGRQGFEQVKDACSNTRDDEADYLIFVRSQPPDDWSMPGTTRLGNVCIEVNAEVTA